MSNPLQKYKVYHKNKINIYIHQVCIPLLLVTIYSILPLYISFIINVCYSIIYLLYDIFSAKSFYSVLYLQFIFLFHLIFRQIFSVYMNSIIHIISWVLQIIGHTYFEKNTPAFLDNLYDSFLFAPYFVFIETFYESSFDIKDKYIIIKNNYDITKKSIIYFAGLYEKAHIEYKDISDTLPDFNHIYINVNFSNNDIFKDILIKILDELKNIDIECIIGFSFGGSLSLQFKKLYNKSVKCILISPGGFISNSKVENIIYFVSKIVYSICRNDKWYMLKNYPLYQNTNNLLCDDYIIVSLNDYIHNSKLIKNHMNTIIFENIPHLDMIYYIQKQKLISQLILNDYCLDKVIVRPYKYISNISKIINEMYH